jgi:hypothetical protein
MDRYSIAAGSIIENMSGPKLIKLSDAAYGCSQCLFTLETPKPEVCTEEERAVLRENTFAEHLKQSHSGGDLNQAAAQG